jgi:hypothetical protein
MIKLLTLLFLLLFSINLTFAVDEIPELSVEELNTITDIESDSTPQIPTINQEELEQLVESTKENEAPPVLLEEEIIELQKSPEEKQIELDNLEKQNTLELDNSNADTNTSSSFNWFYIMISFIGITSVIGFFIFKNND